MGIPLTDIGHEREQGDVAGALDGHRELPLVGGAGARDPPRQDPPTLRHEAPETSDILVVNLLHLVHAELADLLPTIALPSLDHRHWSLPMFGPIVDSRTVPTLCFNLLQLPCRTRPQPSQQAGWSHAAHQVGTALERRLVLCRGRRRLFLPASAPPEKLDAVCHHFVLRPLLPFGRLPRALGQAPLDQGRSPFFQILFARLGLLPPGDDGDVAHLIPTLSRLRGIAPIDGQIKAAARCPAWRVPALRVSGQISDKGHPVEARHALRSLPFRSTGCGSRGCLRACGPLDPDRQIPENDPGGFEVAVHGLRGGGLALDPEEDVGALPLFLDLERQAASPPLLDLEQLGPFPFEESPKRLHLGLARLLRQSRLVDDDHLVLWHPSTSSPVVSAGSPQAPDCFQTLNRFMADAPPPSPNSPPAAAPPGRPMPTPPGGNPIVSMACWIKRPPRSPPCPPLATTLIRPKARSRSS